MFLFSRRSFCSLLSVPLLTWYRSASPNVASAGRPWISDLTDQDAVVAQCLLRRVEESSLLYTQNDTALSEQLFDAFYLHLDPQQLCFLRDDISAETHVRGSLIAQLRNRQIEFVNRVFHKFLERDNERWRAIFAAIPTLETRESAGDESSLTPQWATSPAELERRRIDALTVRLTALQKTCSLDRARVRLTESYERQHTLIQRMPRHRLLERFLTTLLKTFDPVGEFLAPESMIAFERRGPIRFSGVGISIDETDDRVEITKIHVGSPADKSNVIQSGDGLVAVSRPDSVPVVVADTELPEIRNSLYAPRGSKITLELQRADGTIVSDVLIANPWPMEDDGKLTSSVISLKRSAPESSATVGILQFPKVLTVPDPTAPSEGTRQLQSMIKTMDAEGAEVLIIDLRESQTVAFDTLLDLLAILLGDAPVAQVICRNPTDCEILRSTRGNVRWNRPVVVVCNEKTKGNAEAFAAAIQDTRRGLLFGSSATFGQTLLRAAMPIRCPDRSRFEESGLALMTVSQICRISGKSIDGTGVASDIIWQPSKNSESRTVAASRLRETTSIPADLLVAFDQFMNPGILNELRTRVTERSTDKSSLANVPRSDVLSPVILPNTEENQELLSVAFDYVQLLK